MPVCGNLILLLFITLNYETVIKVLTEFPSNSIEITLQYGCSPVHFQNIFITLPLKASLEGGFSNKCRASNKHPPLRRAATLGIHVEISVSL